MDSTVLSLLGAFLLSIIGLLAFIWSMRRGLLVENPKAASVIFARGEIGKVDDPALDAAARASMQDKAIEPGSRQSVADPDELRDRVGGRCVLLVPGVHVHRLRVHVAAGWLRGRPRLLHQAARARLAGERSVDDFRPDAHGAPQCGALRLDHQCRTGRDRVGAAAAAAYAGSWAPPGPCSAGRSSTPASRAELAPSPWAGAMAWSISRFHGRSRSSWSRASRW